MRDTGREDHALPAEVEFERQPFGGQRGGHSCGTDRPGGWSDPTLTQKLSPRAVVREGDDELTLRWDEVNTEMAFIQTASIDPISWRPLWWMRTGTPLVKFWNWALRPRTGRRCTTNTRTWARCLMSNGSMPVRGRFSLQKMHDSKESGINSQRLHREKR